jgi:HAMP domain-containing protein
MKTLRRAFGLGLLLAVLLLPATGIRADDAAPAPVTDPALVGQHYRQVVTRPEFEETGEPLANTRFEDMLSQWFKSIGAEIGSFKYASQMPAFESLLMTLLVALAISVLLYIMVRVTRRLGRMEPEPREDSAGEKAFRPPEFYDEEIEQAVRAGDWHAAWLAAWRQFLSRLERRNLVDADRTRTNREYLRQLTARPLPGTALPLLTGMVDAYDRFIYGRLAIGEAEWNRFHGQIDETALLLHLDDRKTTGIKTP